MYWKWDLSEPLLLDGLAWPWNHGLHHETLETHERGSNPSAKPESMESSEKAHRSRNPAPDRWLSKHFPGQHATSPFFLFRVFRGFLPQRVAIGFVLPLDFAVPRL